jgi:hypothetical protein
MRVVRPSKIAALSFVAAGVGFFYIAATHKYVDVGWLVNLLCFAAGLVSFAVAALIWLVAWRRGRQRR